jgi:hypothetical protein
MLVTGQVHGGLAQGIGQALLEEMHYDPSGELITGTLNDYAMPKASFFPEFETHHTETTTPKGWRASPTSTSPSPPRRSGAPSTPAPSPPPWPPTNGVPRTAGPN